MEGLPSDGPESFRGYQLRSNGDTEVVLELYARENAACLSRLRGMFAFAIWDESEKTCFLARDPSFGVRLPRAEYSPVLVPIGARRDEPPSVARVRENEQT